MIAVRISLEIGAASVAIAGIVGVFLGMVAGYFGGWVDDVIMRISDSVLAIPIVLLALSVLAVVGGGIRNLILVIAFTQWMTYARTARAETLALREQDYVRAARATGARSTRILRRHILPHLLPSATALATLNVSVAILLEAGLSYLGLGVQPPDPSLGSMLTDGRQYIYRAELARDLPRARAAATRPCDQRARRRGKLVPRPACEASCQRDESAMSRYETYLADARERHLGELFDYLRMPSISTLPQHAGDIRACAEWMRAHLQRIGLHDVRLIETPGNPIVYGELLDAGEGAPTLLVYGHYDVQPADPFELWETPPFEPAIREGRIYARGSTDNKGPLFVYLKALETILAVDGRLPVQRQGDRRGGGGAARRPPRRVPRGEPRAALLRRLRHLRLRAVRPGCALDPALAARHGGAAAPRRDRRLRSALRDVRRRCAQRSPRAGAVCSRRCTTTSGASPSRGSTTPSVRSRPRRSPSGSGCRSTRRSYGRRSAPRA